MSNLRLFGLILGISGIIITFLIYRGPKWKKSNFILYSLFNILLILVSINPDLLNVVRDMLSLHNAQRGRILALLVISNLFFLFLLLYFKAVLENLRSQFDKLVRYLGRDEILRKIEIKDKIKPIMILIPAYNEADNLKELLPLIPERINGTEVGTLIIDDGSDDETYYIAGSFKNVFPVKNPINRGGGAALRLGYDILNHSNALLCVTMDADGQHRPQDIEKLVRPLLNDQYDLVIGSRILGSREKDSVIRYVGVRFFSILISFLLGKKITDPSSGFRAFKIKVISNLNLYEDQYHTSELLIDAVKKGMKIKEEPITILKRKYGKTKKGTELKYGLQFAKTILKAWWR
ncbi:MAG: glycosyltransferase family 2 protein [Deltaproteobacteria bacterium]|nr:glycosyltransferase family 2 protein [Deltaproteobacteria bacterium]